MLAQRLLGEIGEIKLSNAANPLNVNHCFLMAHYHNNIIKSTTASYCFHLCLVWCFLPPLLKKILPKLWSEKTSVTACKCTNGFKWHNKSNPIFLECFASNYYHCIIVWNCFKPLRQYTPLREGLDQIDVPQVYFLSAILTALCINCKLKRRKA